jgi:hypothetical protein
MPKRVKLYILQSLDVGELATDGLNKIVGICANQCVLADYECEAFYIESKSDGTECHMVDEDIDSFPRTIGHGYDREDIYYVKSVSSRLAIPSCKVLEKFKKKILELFEKLFSRNSRKTIFKSNFCILTLFFTFLEFVDQFLENFFFEKWTQSSERISKRFLVIN